MIDLLQKETERALEEGYSALRVTGEMTWALRGHPGSDRLMEYENKLNKFLPNHQALGLCQYDRTEFDSEVLLGVLRTHPIAVIGDEAYENFYFIPPEDLLGENPRDAEFRSWEKGLKRSKSSKLRRKHLNSLIRSISEVNQLLVRTEDKEELVRETCDILAETRGYGYVWLALVDDSNQVETVAHAGFDAEQHLKPLREQLETGELPEYSREALTESGIVIHDPPISTSELKLTEGLRNKKLLTTRLEYGGKVYGLLSASMAAKFVSSEEKDLLEEVVGDVAFGLQDIATEIALQRSERKYRTVFETTGTAMIVIEEDTTISLVNEETVNLSGYTKEEVEGNLSWTELVATEDDLERMKQYHHSRREDPTAAPNQYEFKLVDKKGHEKDVLISIDVIPGTKKSVASLIDITGQKQTKRKLRQSFVELAETTSRVLGVRDPYTQKHELRVGELARKVGERMGLSEDKLLGLYIGGVLHDIGKIAIPETILTKPGELKDVEWEMIKSHPKVGYNQILADTDFPWQVAEMTLHHHERLDGSGYPDGLEGDELTTEVRILGAVDVVEAMSTRRPYREARSKERTLNVLKKGKEEKFGPEAVEVLVAMIKKGEIKFG